MSTYQAFVFRDYSFDAAQKTLSLTYGYDNQLTFTETMKFDFEFANYDSVTLDRACQLLFFMAGVSYYKAYLPQQIRVDSGVIDAHLAEFLSKTYQRGLGEYFYQNQLDPHTKISFPITSHSTLNMLSVGGEGLLVGLGGGKDSLVSVELLRGQPRLATWSLGHRAQLQPLVERVGLPHLWVERTLDSQISALNQQGAYNGHVPISAIFACVGAVVAVLGGYKDVVVSNENSANEPTLTYQGVAINHQYSKSLEFEQDFQAILAGNFGSSLRYYSLLRPYSELRISELFEPWFDTYADVFSSCNRAYTGSSTSMSWCGQCPKCAFVFLALTPFIDQAKLEKLWGKNLLQDPALESTYKQLLGIDGQKPLDCVGEIQESRSAMQLASQHYPELAAKYTFELTPDYDFRAPAGHSIPPEISAIATDTLIPQG